MTSEERARHELHQRLEEVLGPDPAGTLMEHLPPSRWPDLATKQDVADLGTALRTEIQASGDRILATLRAEFANQTKAMFLAIVTIVLTMAGLTFGLVVSLVP